jgi:hypothetical protein
MEMVQFLLRNIKMSNETLSLKIQAVNSTFQTGAATKNGELLIEDNGKWRELTVDEFTSISESIHDLKRSSIEGLAAKECTSRIERKWDSTGQLNASLGIYDENDLSDCRMHISVHREALEKILLRDDLLEIDITDDQYWPVFE